MTNTFITPFPQMSTITGSVKSELINVEGYFQNSEKPNANGKNLPGTIWRFIYDNAGHRNHLTVINPESLSDETNSNPEVNRYYRVSGFAIQPKEGYSYLFFLNGTKSE
jgi:hypothetical protein